MDVILARYNEIALKSDQVRRKFEYALRRNMIDMLASDSVEATVRLSNSRLYVESENPAALDSLRRVFGVASMSVASVLPADASEIASVVSEMSREVLSPGMTFAIDARRDDGGYPFTSMELERAVGSAVLESNAGRGIKVDLSDPDRTFFIEVRSNKAYVFTSYIRCHGGLPLGTQGRVLAYVHDDRGLASAWLMMKRGCKVTVRGDYRIPVLKRFDPFLKTLPEDEAVSNKVLGYVVGDRLGEGTVLAGPELPVFMPTVGMDDGAVAEIVARMTSDDPYGERMEAFP